MSLKELYEMLEQYERQVQFLKKMDLLSEEENKSMVNKTKLVFEEIDKRSVNNEVS